ncbi:rhodanese-related sulfurtransferase [Aquimarina sp. MAR_2010_214]|uniref:rhodanese-like domain-containing protein n=1 Tax=Aquimarina sp. MAR_2010_214 TaxID=1250026 RepID=UPI000C70BA1F|nr:rhodanese-like domain-containing protein [Aquimarina sp. MAR_2010_214]PKV52401.1 rhodanese-related sulfurtransferase [Aquimarina sp. MAR_2010_214]
MNIKSFLVIIFISSILFNCKRVEKDDVVELITVEEIDSLLEMSKVQLIDVRTPGEYAEGYIEGAVNIDFRNKNFKDLITKVDKTKPVIVYCARGARSKKCSAYMRKAGFTKIYDLDGGITQWKFKRRKLVK